MIGTYLSGLLPSVIGDGGPDDWAPSISTAFQGFIPALLPVAVLGLTIAVTLWGFPKVVGFFKKTAK